MFVRTNSLMLQSTSIILLAIFEIVYGFSLLKNIQAQAFLLLKN